MRSVRSAIAIAVALSATPASALIIDEFDGAQSLSRDGSDDFVGPRILGGRRVLQLISARGNSVEIDAQDSGILDVTVVNELPEGGLSLFISWSGLLQNDEPVGLGGVDLTEGGTQDAFAIRVLSASGPTPLMLLASTQSGTRQIEIDLPSVASPHTFLVPFSLFSPPADLTAVDGLGFVASLLPSSSGKLQIDWIGTVPEPSTMILATMGFVALFAFEWRRRKRWASLNLGTEERLCTGKHFARSW